MDYGSPVGQRFYAADEERSPPLTKNQRRLKLRHSLSSRTMSQLQSLVSDDEKDIKVAKTRRRSSSGSSTHSNTSSRFDNFTQFRLYSEFPQDSTPPSPLDEGMPNTPADKFGSSLRRPDGLRKASFYSEASTLVNEGFGDILGLGSQSVVGPRFYDSGSGSENSSFRKRSSLSPATSTNTSGVSRRRVSAKRQAYSDKADGFSTPSPKKRNAIPQHHYADIHQEDMAKYIEQLEAQTQDLTQQIHNLTSPTSSVSNVTKLKKLTAENRALQNEIAEWETAFEDKVKEESRAKIIANEVEARQKIKTMEQALEESRELAKMLQAELERMKTILQEVERERDAAEEGKRELLLRIDALSDLLREKEDAMYAHGIQNSVGRKGGLRGRFSGSIMAALRGQRQSQSVASSQYDSDEDDRGSNASSYAHGDRHLNLAAQLEAASNSSSRASSPYLGQLNSRRRMRTFQRGSSPQPLVLANSPGADTPRSIATIERVLSPAPSQCHSHAGPMVSSSRPSTAHSNARVMSLYAHGNASNDSIDSTGTTSVKSVMANPTDSLFAELSRFDDGMSDTTSHLDDASQPSRFHSRCPSYSAFSSVHRNSRPAEYETECQAVIPSPALTPTPTRPSSSAQMIIIPSAAPPVRATPAQRGSLFSVFTNTATVPLHLVADAMSRYALGKLLIAIGSGLRSPRSTIVKARTRACDAVNEALVGGFRAVDRVTKKRKKGCNQRGREGRTWGHDKCCGRCSMVDRGRKKGGRSARRSASAPTSRISGLYLKVESPDQSRDSSPARDQSPSRVPHNHRKRRVSTTSKVGGKVTQDAEPVKRQRQVHAGDNVWMWVRFFIAVVVTLGAVATKDDRNSKPGIFGDIAIADDDDYTSSDDVDFFADDDFTLRARIEKWRRQRLAEVGR